MFTTLALMLLLFAILVWGAGICAPAKWRCFTGVTFVLMLSSAALLVGCGVQLVIIAAGVAFIVQDKTPWALNKFEIWLAVQDIRDLRTAEPLIRNMSA